MQFRGVMQVLLFLFFCCSMEEQIRLIDGDI